MPRNTGNTRLSIVVLVLLLSSCRPTIPTQAYPTYDPFAPVNGTSVAPAVIQPGVFVVDTKMPHDGLPPTRAPLSVTSSPPNTIHLTPTPDQPHDIPAPRQSVETYTVQAGDTLGSIAQGYGISLTALLQANSLNESSVL